MDFQARINSDNAQISFWRRQRVSAAIAWVSLSLATLLSSYGAYHCRSSIMGLFAIVNATCAAYCWDRLYRYARRCERRALRRKERDVRAALDPDHWRHYIN